MNLLKRKKFSVGGNDTDFNLEHRIFNISCFMITIFGILGGLGNYFSELHIATVWLSVIGVLISGYLYYVARVRKIFSTTVIIIYLAATVMVLGLMFFFNNGTQGTILYLIIMLLNIFLLIVPTRYQYFVGGVLYLTLFILIALEFIFPQWIVPYHSVEEMLTDHILTMFYTVFFTTSIIVLFRKNYLSDRKKILSQNDSLVLLNQQINFQKEELENKTKQLLLAIETSNERNKYIETLLKELNHRVKNNLQLVISLLQKQANSSPDDSVKDALLDTKNRLVSLILIHQRLYGQENATSIFMPKYLKELTESILISFNDLAEDNIMYDTDEVWLNVETAISVGLIANELITNSFKHAFHGTEEPKLIISFKKTGTENRLSIRDNGIGMQEDKADTSFGMELIGLLTKQIKGQVEKKCEANKGCCFTIIFNDLKSKI